MASERIGLWTEIRQAVAETLLGWALAVAPPRHPDGLLFAKVAAAYLGWCRTKPELRHD